MSVKTEWQSYTEDLQNRICSALEDADGDARFREDHWQRDGGGGGRTRVIESGKLFEKGGVNISAVHGELTDTMRHQLKMQGSSWFACGLSLVLHPVNPFVPTVHCNFRMFECYDEKENIIDQWFGGGADLTPYYVFEEDVKHFHQTFFDTCNRFDTAFFPRFKKNCDDYFVNYHRNNERRGLGGIFYDYCRPDEKHDAVFWLNFNKACGDAFLEAYLPIAQRRKTNIYNDEHRFWQEIRRGRYTEFNLVHDRGTLFGLKTGGRTESILMSLPPTARFVYNYQPATGSEEEKLLKLCLNPIDWV